MRRAGHALNEARSTDRYSPIAALVFAAVAVGAIKGAQLRAPVTSAGIACRVIEAEASAKFGVRLVIFHYRDAADRGRLGQLLRGYDGADVSFQTRDGISRPATVLRLKTCFGRGMLVYAASAPPLAKGDDFVLEVPGHTPK